ncbi:hypothetical protein GCM10010531_19930 [Blastococcus jejuensis]|uniref:Uncharacterized protein n=1 Tax=Blastococcus jejuensis TaxID=351224 RepID=A0ABP6P4V4_9ACTN
MTEHRHDPSGTRREETDHLTDRATLPGENDASASAIRGAYEASEEDKERGKAVKPGN